MWRRRRSPDLLHTGFMREARRHWSRPAVADSTGRASSYGDALVHALALAHALRPCTRGQRMVGVLLPASVAGVVTNLAVLSAGRVPVNLNFTSGPEAMAAAVAGSGIRTILTSRRFLARSALSETPEMIFLEDLRSRVGKATRIRAFLAARLAPMALLRRWYGAGIEPDSLATVIFSSGSTGEPKGVAISHANILANIDALARVFSIRPSDCFLGVLPFFHSFGFTGTVWLPLLQGACVVYHPNPMDARTIGDLAHRHGATMLISTPTFCGLYLRQVPEEHFAHLRYAIVGAEKLREPLAEAFRDKYGISLLEGYGCTEMSPVVSVNRPPEVQDGAGSTGAKPGSVGRPIPGVEAKVVDLHTGEGPLVNRTGLLLVRGPNLMRGYLNDPARTAEVMRDGWYVTGDVATIDEDGFIYITDRLSRFSKIAGEMVPHLKVEEAIDAVLDEPCSAVTAVPDEARGERLVAFYTRTDVDPGALWERLCRSDLPRLWLPSRDCVLPLEGIPTLGTGKVDLRALRALAAESAGANAAGSG